MIEQMRIVPVQPAEPAREVPCDIKYITISCHLDGQRRLYWTADYHKTIQRAEAEAEYCVPGTLRILEVPE